MRKILCGVLLCGSLAFSYDYYEYLKSYTYIADDGFVVCNEQNISQKICEISAPILAYKNSEKELLSILKYYTTEQELQNLNSVDIKKKYYKSMKERHKTKADSLVESMEIDSIEICIIWKELTPKEKNFVSNLKYDSLNDINAINEADVKLHCKLAEEYKARRQAVKEKITNSE